MFGAEDQPVRDLVLAVPGPALTHRKTHQLDSKVLRSQHHRENLKRNTLPELGKANLPYGIKIAVQG